MIKKMRYWKIILLSIMISVVSVENASADLTDLFGKIGEAIENGSVEDMIEGVFSTSDIEVADIAGEWTSEGSAVCFQSEDFLNKAGGVVAASTLETKLNPYFEKYGLTGAVFNIKEDGTFTLNVKQVSLQGFITKSEDENFVFTFEAFGKMKVGELKTYVQKTSKSMDIMFDASKLQSLVKTIASLIKIEVVQTVSSLLNSYEGICVGFELKKTSVDSSENSYFSPFGIGQSGGNSESNTQSSGQQEAEQQQTEAQDSSVNRILNLFKK